MKFKPNLVPEELRGMTRLHALLTIRLLDHEGWPDQVDFPRYPRAQLTSQRHLLSVLNDRIFHQPRSLGVPSGSLLRLPELQAPIPRLARPASLPPETTRPTRQRVPSMARVV